MINLNSSISQLKGVGKIISNKLFKLDIETVEDLLYYFPWRYEDIGKTKSISQLKIGETANIQGEIELIQNKRSFKKRLNITEALVSDDSGTIKVVWFNQAYLSRNLKAGDSVSLSGKLEEKNGQLTLSSPVYEKIGNNQELIHTQGIIPFYHLSAGITNKQLRYLLKQVMPLTKELEDSLPFDTKKRLKLLDIKDTIEKIHFPKDKNDIKEAQKRLAFEELFGLQIKSLTLRHELKNKKSPVIKFRQEETKNFVSSLPFKLMPQQKQSAWEILQDIETKKPMTRLLQGDVGSGKTVVASMALLNSALNRKKNHAKHEQSLLMAPTEILAQQHYQTIQRLLKDFNIKISLYTRSFKKSNFITQTEKEDNKKGKKKAEQIKKAKYFQADIIIGTQSLIQKDTPIEKPALVIVDEQHRFGVEQRQKLAKRADELTPHYLSLTATPIPRSLALSIYGHLDVSNIKTLPKDRQSINTKVVSEENKYKVHQFIKQRIENNEQVFVICPLVDPSDKLGVRSVKEEYKNLSENVFPDIDIAFLHGKMKAEEKTKVMQDFLSNKFKILVSTSVVEVGVDIKNATVMMIEDASRFGLAQLHQFRGRVGRSNKKSYCFLMLSNISSTKSKERLQVLERYNNGFKIAEEDLKLRGSGEMYGTIQSGFPELKFASLFDLELIKKAQDEAKTYIKNQ
ncbi:MAG TPA: ATP-dependent DNA helicase RecG [Patescibacteria group bacterium]|nr:ATP-dependent DNA helicase RecG [Patescibacteria group bacterium]